MFFGVLCFGVGCSKVEPRPDTVDGMWGSDDILIEVQNGRTHICFACAEGDMDGTIQLDRNGEFATLGTIAIGPVVRETLVAEYSGQVSGDTLTMEITVVDSGTSLGPFTAVRVRSSQIVQCRQKAWSALLYHVRRWPLATPRPIIRLLYRGPIGPSNHMIR
jgi:hypothetical protein